MDTLFFYLQAIDHCAKRLHGNSVDISRKKKFVFAEEDLCLEPESYMSPGSSWTVETTDNNVVSSGNAFCILKPFSGTLMITSL